MKKFFVIILTALTLSVSLFAQNHMTFKGIPITGSVESMKIALYKSGFTYSTQLDAIIGTFAGVTNCAISIGTTSKSQRVFCIGVIFPDDNNWIDAKYRYVNLKESLTKKYGVPQSLERFNEPYYDGDKSEFYAIKNNMADYFSLFYSRNGIIELSINSIDSRNGYITITYYDNEGYEIAKAEMNSIIANDL